MIDDEKLQELLGRASSLYNNGQYQAAIQAWQEALSVDPSNQKAREGIRMATLLIGEWEPAAAAGGEEPAPADAGGAAADSLPADEVEARVDLGVARVKQLLAGRKFEEAIEVARGLLPMAPDSEAVRRLLEEAQHGFESAPFIDEHLTLARELLDQERYAEAEVECKKIFVIDAHHPAGRALMTEIKERVQASLQRAASQMGGMTVKLSLPQIPRGPAAAPPAPPPSAPEPEEDTAPAPAFDPAETSEAGGEPAGAAAFAGGAPEAAVPQEEVESRNLLEQAFEQAGVADEAPAGGLPVSDVSADAESPFELSHGPAGPEVVEAKTVVAPALRTAAAAGPGGPAEEAAKPGPGPAAKAAAPAPAMHPPAAAPATAAKGETSAGKPPQAKDDPSAWETELAQLNLREGARGMLKGTGARPGSVPAAEVGDEDLMALLDGEIGGPAPTPAAPGGAPAPPPAAGAQPPAARTAPAKPAREPKRVEAAAEPAIRERPAERPREVERPRPSRPPAAPRPRSSSPVLYVLLGLVLLAGGGAAWYFYFQPRMTAASAGAPAQIGSPPQGTPAGPEPMEAPIPTPIGGPSRPQGDAAAGETTGGQVATAGAPGSPGASAPQPQSAPPPSAEPAAAAPPSLEPIKPEEAPRLSPEETRRRIAVFTADGRRLMGQGKWREARAKFNAVLALDPANLDVKEMADQVQAKIDEEQRLQNDMDSAKQLMKDKDFENALRKLYRLPRDKGLGDIDLFIRNAWFNWAVVQLKAGNSKDAINKLNEVLALDPDDAEAIRLQEVAERYTAKAKDRVYYAFTDTLRLRAFDQRK